MTVLYRTATALCAAAIVLTLPACSTNAPTSRITIGTEAPRPLTAQPGPATVRPERPQSGFAAKRRACTLFATRIAPVFDVAVQQGDPLPVVMLVREGPGGPWERFQSAVTASADQQLMEEVALMSGAAEDAQPGSTVADLKGGRQAVTEACAR